MTLHLEPIRGYSATRCCGQRVDDLPEGDRVTPLIDGVTCGAEQTWQELERERISGHGWANPNKMIADAEKRLAKTRWHLFPWTGGTWVNAKGDIVYRGNGGNEREEASWLARGPWLLITDISEDRHGPWCADLQAEVDQLRSQLETIREAAS